jgi:ankyrin repeat protein
MLLKSGAETNMAMADGRTPLHVSAESGTIAVIRQLLANGADPVRVDNVSTSSVPKKVS